MILFLKIKKKNEIREGKFTGCNNSSCLELIFFKNMY